MAKLAADVEEHDHFERMCRTKLRCEGSAKQPNIINRGYDKGPSSHGCGRGQFMHRQGTSSGRFKKNCTSSPTRDQNKVHVLDEDIPMTDTDSEKE